MMEVIDVKIETNAIHKGLDGCVKKPLPVENDTGGVITILEIPQHNSYTGIGRSSFRKPSPKLQLSQKTQ